MNENVTPLKTVTAEKARRLTALVTGELEPPNPYAAFIVSRIRELRVEGENVAKQLANARAQVASLEKKAIGLQSAGEQYVQDLMKWDKEESSEPAPQISSAQGEGG